MTDAPTQLSTETIKALREAYMVASCASPHQWSAEGMRMHIIVGIRKLMDAAEASGVAQRQPDRERIYAILYEQLDLSEEVIVELAECGNLGAVADAVLATLPAPEPAPGAPLSVEEIETTIRIEFDHSEDSAGVRRAAERVWTFLEARAKTLARQTTTSVLPLREGQAEECDGGLRTGDLAYATKDAYEVARHIVGHLEGNCGLSFTDVKQDDWDAITRLVATLAIPSTSRGTEA